MLQVIKKLYVVFLIMLACFGVQAQYTSATLQQQLTSINAMTNKQQALNEIIDLASDKHLSIQQLLLVKKSHAMLLRENNQPDAAIDVVLSSIDLAQQHQLSMQVADAQKLLGILYYYGSENGKALHAYRRSLATYEPLAFPLITASLHNNIGLVLAAIGDYKGAISSYKSASVLYDEFGNASDRTDIEFNIAGLYGRLQQYDVAIEMFLKVITDQKRHGSADDLAMSYGNLGNLYTRNKNYVQGKFYYEKALKHYEATNQSYFIASQSHNIAQLYVYTEQTDQAKLYAQRAIKLGEMTKNKYAHVGGLDILAKSFFQEKNYDLALHYIELSLGFATKSSMQERILEYLGIKALIQAAREQTSKAATTFGEFITLNKAELNRQLEAQVYAHQMLQQSSELEQQLAQMKLNEALTTAQLNSSVQQRNILILFMIVLFSALLFIYRRRVESRLKLKLEQQVAQRTSELEQVAQKLHQSDKVKSQFIANMSHEIRTPLTSIIGRAQSMANGEVKLNEQQREVEIILNSSNHVLAILNDILDVSRIEANKLSMDYQQHDIHAVIEEVRQLFAEQAAKKGLVLKVKHHLPLPFYIDIDRTRFKQVIINLCSNAIKFTHSGGITIAIEINHNMLAIKVIDTGIGIKVEQLDEVFKSFSQADNSISRRFGGSGLGLYLSQKLAHLMSGHIEVASEINNGSVFTLSLPYNVPEAAAELTKVDKVPRDSIGQSVLTGRVLLAEDHGDNRRLIARILTIMGLSVFEASNGKEALALCQQYPFDLILMDIQMPEVDGVGALKSLKEQGYKQPIIALTANAMPHDVDYYLDIGFDDYLAKPIERKRFIATVAHYLKQAVRLEQNDPTERVDISDLTADFVTSLGQDHEQLSRYIQQRDYASIAILSHRLAGAASMFGYNTMASLSGDIERKILKKQYDEADNLIRMLKAMISRTVLEL